MSSQEEMYNGTNTSTSNSDHWLNVTVPILAVSSPFLCYLVLILKSVFCEQDHFDEQDKQDASSRDSNLRSAARPSSEVINQNRNGRLERGANQLSK